MLDVRLHKLTKDRSSIRGISACSSSAEHSAEKPSNVSLSSVCPHVFCNSSTFHFTHLTYKKRIFFPFSFSAKFDKISAEFWTEVNSELHPDTRHQRHKHDRGWKVTECIYLGITFRNNWRCLNFALVFPLYTPWYCHFTYISERNVLLFYFSDEDLHKNIKLFYSWRVNQRVSACWNRQTKRVFLCFSSVSIVSHRV